MDEAQDRYNAVYEVLKTLPPEDQRNVELIRRLGKGKHPIFDEENNQSK